MFTKPSPTEEHAIKKTVLLRGKKMNKVFFYMKVPSDLAPISESFTEDNSKEHLKWVSLDEDIKMYPEFFRTELKNPTDTVKHFIKDER